MIEKIMRALTRLHLWLGELLGLTHYRSCYDCKYHETIEREPGIESIPGHVWCLKYAEEDCLAATCSSEAVWCRDFESTAKIYEESL